MSLCPVEPLVPTIVTKAISYLDSKGVKTEGLFRISGAKSRINEVRDGDGWTGRCGHLSILAAVYLGRPFMMCLALTWQWCNERVWSELTGMCAGGCNRATVYFSPELYWSQLARAFSWLPYQLPPFRKQ